MKQIEILLQRYAEGVITPEEQSELNKLTHRDDVLHSASIQATKIRRRRNAMVTATASILLVVGLFLTLNISGNQNTTQSPLLAKANPSFLDTSPTVAPTLEPAGTTTTISSVQSHETTLEPAQITTEPISSPAPRRQVVETSQPQIHSETEPMAHVANDPVVACNTQCSPDSVINDIWNFLNA